MEAHSGIESLTGYVARELAPDLRQATNWSDVHKQLAEHGLAIEPRGAGLVIGDRDLSLWARASQCSRDLSLKALVGRLGPFEPATSQQPQPPKRTYLPRPKQSHPASATLFAQYQRERQAAIAARKQGMEQIKRENTSARARLQDWHNKRRAVMKATTRGVTRKVVQASIKRRVEVARGKLRAEAATKRQVLIAATAMPTWADWLAGKAERGDTEALTVLRSKQERAEQLRDNLLTVEQAERGKAVVFDYLKPQARKDGAMAYHTVDGGMVIDRTRQVQAKTATAGAALVALSLAAERFEGQALIVEGSQTFRQDVARLAALHNFKVRFADPAMEATRQAAVAEKVKQPPPKDAVDRWIEQRNATREKVSSIDYNRRWRASDAGPASYQGRRRLDDGSEVLLLKRGDEMLVKPASPRVVAKASKWKLGRTVTLDARGRFLTRVVEHER